MLNCRHVNSSSEPSKSVQVPNLPNKVVVVSFLILYFFPPIGRLNYVCLHVYGVYLLNLVYL